MSRVGSDVEHADRPAAAAAFRPPAGQPQPTSSTGPPLPEWQRMVQQRGPVVLLAAMMLVYFAVFGTLTWRQHANFGTLGYDMGIYDQAIWLLSRFKTPFVTVRGLNYFGHHVNAVTILLVPFYWLGAGPGFLYLVETASIAAGAVPIWLLGRDRLANPWIALGPVAAFLLYPTLQWINWWHFHPDALIVAPLLFAYWLATRQRWSWFFIAVAVTLSCKEDAALAVFGLGALLLLRRQWRAGALTAVAGLIYFQVAAWIIRRANGGLGALYAESFPGYGDSLASVLSSMLRHPGTTLSALVQPDRLQYYRDVLSPMAFLPVAAAPVLLITAPQLAVNALTSYTPARNANFHYSSIVAAEVFAAAVEACAQLGRRVGIQRFLVGLLVAAALATNVARAPSPLGAPYHTGIWAAPQPKHTAMREALLLVPPSAGVSATDNLIPHLTHRVHAYIFPHPWQLPFWGVQGSSPPDPRTVDYLVLDMTTTSIGIDQEPTYRELTNADGEFHVVYDRAGIVVARRNSAGVTSP